MNKINKKKVLMVTIGILIVLVIIILNILNKIRTKEEGKDSNSNSTINDIDEVIIDNRTEKKKKQELISKLKRATESERIRTYLGIYFKYLENEDYESAYNLLYDEFKQNYFPTFEDYKKYIKECNYPELLSIDYKNIMTQGYYYIVTVGIGDLLSKSNTTNYEMKFIVKENDYNDFYISFQM